MKTLFDKPLSHSTDPITSLEAEDRLRDSGGLNSQKRLVLEAIYDYLYRGYYPKEDFTAKELSKATNIDYHLIQRRLSGLTEYLTDTGEKRDGCRVLKLKD